MTSKQRAYLMSLAQKEQSIIHIGKSGITPELTKAVDEALAARELVKVGILQNCFDDPKELAVTLAERTSSQLIQIIGKKIVLYRQGKDDKRKIELPKAKKNQD